MKKSAVLSLVIASLVAGCSSGHPETATEPVVSPQQAAPEKSDGIAEWIRSQAQNPDLLKKLNVIPQEKGKNLDASSLCADKDVVEAIENRQYAPVIVQNGMDAVDSGIAILKTVPDSGSKFVPKHLEEIESLAEKIRNDVPAEGFSWNDADALTLEKNLRAAGFDPADPNAEDNFVAMLRGDSCSTILPRYCDFIASSQSGHKESLENTAKLDILLTCDLTDWASELRLNYPQNDYRYDRARQFMSDASVVSLRKQLFVENLKRYGVEKAFAQIAPPDPQYNALVAARKLYVDAIAAGGWPEVKAPSKIDPPRVGKSYAYVPALRARLIAEGYPVDNPESDVMDQPLIDNIVLYRDMHQLNQKAVVDTTLFKNLAVGPENRLEMIDLTIQKYREQAVGSLGYYVKVNIPDFHVEVWKDGKRVLRHRIVVGSNIVQTDPVTKKPVPDMETLLPVHPNRTPLQTSKINEVIFNPYWNVPERIRVEELLPKLAENPNYYAENNYEEVNVDNPKLYYVRELPNPKNSLGQVKFMYPNPHSTYLHDTPNKAAFKQPLRGLSHGCMRVQNPLVLAELILTNDGQWDKKAVNDMLNAEVPEQVTIELKNPVDVDVVYLNTRVDDSGVVAFLSDIYQYDAIRLGRVVPKQLPKPPGWKPPKKKK